MPRTPVVMNVRRGLKYVTPPMVSPVLHDGIRNNSFAAVTVHFVQLRFWHVHADVSPTGFWSASGADRLVGTYDAGTFSRERQIAS
jgi:hypothetical protein